MEIQSLNDILSAFVYNLDNDNEGILKNTNITFKMDENLLGKSTYFKEAHYSNLTNLLKSIMLSHKSHDVLFSKIILTYDDDIERMVVKGKLTIDNSLVDDIEMVIHEDIVAFVLDFVKLNNEKKGMNVTDMSKPFNVARYIKTAIINTYKNYITEFNEVLKEIENI